MAYPRYRAARAHKFWLRTAGNLTLNSNVTWADLPTIGTTWDTVLAAQVGDTVECGLSAFVESAVVGVSFDVFTIVSAAAVNQISTGTTASNSTFGVTAWYSPASMIATPAGSAMYTLTGGDISGGTVTLRLRYLSDSATNRTLRGTAPTPLQFWVKNLGPADPN
jgi:hypothetical protein